MGSIYRRAKEAFYNFRNTTAGGDGAYVFDALASLDFDTIYTTVSSGALAKSSVQARIWFPQNAVIVKSTIGVGAFTAPTGTGITATYNLVVGEGSTYHNSVAGTLDVAGTQVFDSDVSFGGITSPASVTSVPTRPEALYAVGHELTLRIVLSGGSTNGTITNVKVQLLVAYYDTKPETTSANPNTDF